MSTLFHFVVTSGFFSYVKKTLKIVASANMPSKGRSRTGNKEYRGRVALCREIEDMCAYQYCVTAHSTAPP